MARIRSIHPGLATDESYMELSIAAKAVWPLLWTQADDNGAFEWKPIVLKARLLPADQVEMVAILEEFERLNMVRRFDHSDRPYGVIRNFRKWQRPKKPNAVYPLPAWAIAYACLPSGSEPPSDDADTSSEPVPHQDGTGPEIGQQMEDVGGRMEEVGGEEDKPSSLRSSGSVVQVNGLHAGGAPSASAEPATAQTELPIGPTAHAGTTKASQGSGAKYMSDFELWWKQYPRKVSKGHAFQAYRKARYEASAETLMQALVPFVASQVGKDKQYIPHPASWLNGKRWLDDYSAEVPGPTEIIRPKWVPVPQWQSKTPDQRKEAAIKDAAMSAAERSEAIRKAYPKPICIPDSLWPTDGDAILSLYDEWEQRVQERPPGYEYGSNYWRAIGFGEQVAEWLPHVQGYETAPMSAPIIAEAA